MGQKVNPHGLRVGIIKQWDARWYADKKTFSDFLVEDKKIREFVKTEIDSIIKSSGKNSKRAFDDSRKNIAGVSSIEIERKGAEKTTIFINVAKPGLVIGSKGSGIEALKASLAKK
ncbi:MAG TPA: KH domain-containing protein, partial [Saccharofermentans sp.]|nr:KH domain-containing protein [Saccharofermentans sp.]